MGTLIASGAFSGEPSVHLLAARVRDVNILIASALFLATVSAALVVHPLQLLLVRVLEGYWEQIPGLSRLRFVGIEVNRRRRARLLRTRADAALLVTRLYPDKTADLLPTRLGNVLRAAERRAGQRHGFAHPIEMLPRIYPYLSPTLSAALNDARDELDTTCRMCVVLWLLAATTGVTFLADGAATKTHGVILAAPAALALLGNLSYRGAVQSGQAYGKFLFYAFDLHRRDLIRALGYQPPRNPHDEFGLIQAIDGWLVNGAEAPAGFRERPDQSGNAS